MVSRDHLDFGEREDDGGYGEGPRGSRGKGDLENPLLKEVDNSFLTCLHPRRSRSKDVQSLE